jgi:hypothetical protein
MVATSYLLSNIATRIGNGERRGTLVNRAFDVEATFTVEDDPEPTLNPRLSVPRTCLARATRGTGEGQCGKVVDERGVCPHAGQHI